MENPFVVEKSEQEDGSNWYEIWDHRPESYRRLCICYEDYNDDSENGDPDRGQVQKDAQMIATALNMVYGSRPFKSAKLRLIKGIAK